jgi:hypothetical protein
LFSRFAFIIETRFGQDYERIDSLAVAVTVSGTIRFRLGPEFALLRLLAGALKGVVVRSHASKEVWGSTPEHPDEYRRPVREGLFGKLEPWTPGCGSSPSWLGLPAETLMKIGGENSPPTHHQVAHHHHGTLIVAIVAVRRRGSSYSAPGGAYQRRPALRYDAAPMWASHVEQPEFRTSRARGSWRSSASRGGRVDLPRSLDNRLAEIAKLPGDLNIVQDNNGVLSGLPRQRDHEYGWWTGRHRAQPGFVRSLARPHYGPSS